MQGEKKYVLTMASYTLEKGYIYQSYEDNTDMGTEEFVIFRCKNKHFSVQRFLAVNYFHPTPLWPPKYYQCSPII